MLVLTRKLGECIAIDDHIKIRVVQIKGKQMIVAIAGGLVKSRAIWELARAKQRHVMKFGLLHLIGTQATEANSTTKRNNIPQNLTARGDRRAHWPAHIRN